MLTNNFEKTINILYCHFCRPHGTNTITSIIILNIWGNLDLDYANKSISFSMFNLQFLTIFLTSIAAVGYEHYFGCL